MFSDQCTFSTVLLIEHTLLIEQANSAFNRRKLLRSTKKVSHFYFTVFSRVSDVFEINR